MVHRPSRGDGRRTAGKLGIGERGTSFIPRGGAGAREGRGE